MRRLAALSLMTAAILTARPAAAEPKVAVADDLRVAVSIKPLQSLVAGVMAGIGTPSLIVHGAGSPHTYAIRPSEARDLNRADVVFWIGPIYESFLVKPIAGIGARNVAMIEAPGVQLLAAREGGPWETHPATVDPVRLASLQNADPHIYLDPANAQAMVLTIAATLAEIDPPHMARYQANARTVTERLQALDAELKAELAPVRAVPFVVFHDGYQYLERRFDLTAVGSVVVTPERPPGARRLAEIRDKIKELHAACVFAEPQFDSALVRTVVDGTPAKIGVLDELGATIPPGPDAYGLILRGLGQSLVSCLGG